MAAYDNFDYYLGASADLAADMSDLFGEAIDLTPSLEMGESAMADFDFGEFLAEDPELYAQAAAGPGAASPQTIDPALLARQDPVEESTDRVPSDASLFGDDEDVGLEVEEEQVAPSAVSSWLDLPSGTVNAPSQETQADNARLPTPPLDFGGSDLVACEAEKDTAAPSGYAPVAPLTPPGGADQRSNVAANNDFEKMVRQSLTAHNATLGPADAPALSAANYHAATAPRPDTGLLARPFARPNTHERNVPPVLFSYAEPPNFWWIQADGSLMEKDWVVAEEFAKMQNGPAVLWWAFMHGDDMARVELASLMLFEYLSLNWEEQLCQWSEHTGNSWEFIIAWSDSHVKDMVRYIWKYNREEAILPFLRNPLNAQWLYADAYFRGIMDRQERAQRPARMQQRFRCDHCDHAPFGREAERNYHWLREHPETLLNDQKLFDELKSKLTVTVGAKGKASGLKKDIGADAREELQKKQKREQLKAETKERIKENARKERLRQKALIEKRRKEQAEKDGKN